MLKSSSLMVVCGLIFHGDRVLACRRDPARSFPLHWEFPGGKIEAGESGEAALHRELREELRLKVTIEGPLDPVNYLNDGHNICLVPFLCRPDQNEAPLPLDHVELRWVTPDEAQQLTWAPADIPLVGQLHPLSKTFLNE